MTDCLPVPGYENYLVYNDGRVYSLCRKRFIFENKSRGYVAVVLCKNGKKFTTGAHRLVAKAFIPQPEGKNFVNHINGVKDDNRVQNLEWCTISENQKHAYRLGLQVTPNSLLGSRWKNSGYYYLVNGLRYKSLRSAAKSLGIGHMTFSRMVSRGEFQRIEWSKNV